MRGPLIFACLLVLYQGFTARIKAQDTRLTLRNKETGRLERNVAADTAYIEALIRKSKSIQIRNPDSAILLCRIAAAHGISIAYNDGVAHALLCLGTQVLEYKNDITLAGQYWEQAYFFITHSSYRKGKLLMFYYTSLGGLAYFQGKYDSVAYYNFKVLDIQEQYKVNDTSLLITIYSNLSVIYKTQPEKALQYLKQAENLALALKKDEPLIRVYVNIADIYTILKEYKKAIGYIHNGLRLIERNPASSEIRARNNLYSNLACIHRQNNRPLQALSYYKRSLEEEKKINTGVGPVFCYYGMAQAYIDLNNYKKAENCLMTALSLAQKENIGGVTLQDIYTLAAWLYSTHLKDFEKAYYYRDIGARIHDSLAGREKQEWIADLELKYKTAEKDREITRKQLLLARRSGEIREKNYWIAGISMASVSLLFILGAFYRSNKQKQKLQVERMNSLQKEKEISNLKSVIIGEEKERSRLAHELHDGVMVLFSSVKMKLRKLPAQHESLKHTNDFTDVTAKFDEAIKELRRTAHNLMPDMLLEGGLTEAIFYFCKTLRDNNDLNIIVQNYGEVPRLQEEFELSTYRIIQELVQNIIKHAKASKALVQINFREGLLYITVEDNGTGFESTELTRHTGMGLKSIRTRVKALNGLMDIRSSPGNGTNVYLEFDIRSVIVVRHPARIY